MVLATCAWSAGAGPSNRRLRRLAGAGSAGGRGRQVHRQRSLQQGRGDRLREVAVAAGGEATFDVLRGRVRGQRENRGEQAAFAPRAHGLVAVASDGGVSEAVGADNAATPATSAIAAVCRQQAERRARARMRAPHRGGQSRSRRQRLPWADLLRRVFGIDVLVCPQCAGPRRVLAAVGSGKSGVGRSGKSGVLKPGVRPARISSESSDPRRPVRLGAGAWAVVRWSAGRHEALGNPDPARGRHVG